MGKHGKYNHINVEELLNQYYANDGTFDWKTKTGELGKWRCTLKEIRTKHKLSHDANIMQRVRRHGIGTRKTLQQGGVFLLGRAGAQENGGEDVPKRYQMARQAQNTIMLQTALASPRVMKAVHEVVKGLCSAMGSAPPSPQEISGYLARLMRS